METGGNFQLHSKIKSSFYVILSFPVSKILFPGILLSLVAQILISHVMMEPVSV